ncbi:MAG: hypothetical protein ACXWZS_04910 [Gemmatirosa sp.]
MSHQILRALCATMLAGVALVASACAPDAMTAPTADVAPDAPAPVTARAADGRYVLRLVTPNADDAGLLATIGGAPIDSVTTTAGSVLLLPDADGAMQLVLTARDAALDGVVATIWTGGDAPRVALREVAARGTHAQRALDGYALQIAPASPAASR